jgi:hypothetical protein
VKIVAKLAGRRPVNAEAREMPVIELREGEEAMLYVRHAGGRALVIRLDARSSDSLRVDMQAPTTLDVRGSDVCCWYHVPPASDQPGGGGPVLPRDADWQRRLLATTATSHESQGSADCAHRRRRRRRTLGVLSQN